MSEFPCPMHQSLTESINEIGKDVKTILGKLETMAISAAVRASEAAQLRKEVDDHALAIQSLNDLVSAGKGAAWGATWAVKWIWVMVAGGVGAAAVKAIEWGAKP